MTVSQSVSQSTAVGHAGRGSFRSFEWSTGSFDSHTHARTYEDLRGKEV